MEKDLNKTPFKFIGSDISQVHKLFWNIFKCTVNRKGVTGVIIFVKNINEYTWLLYTNTGKIAVFELITYPKFDSKLPLFFQTLS